MRGYARIFSAVLVAAFFVLHTAAAPAAPAFFATVRQCIDGDTVVLDTGQRVRLAGVDTPEKGSKGTPPQYYAREAQRFTAERTQGREVRVLPLSGASTDRYKRLVAELVLPSGESLNERLLREGMGSFYAHKDLPAQLVNRLTAAQKEALDTRAGCWKHVLSLPEAHAVYVGNRNSKRFFSLGCLRDARVTKRNQVRFANLEAAFRAGYAPARPCGIWPGAE